MSATTLRWEYRPASLFEAEFEEMVDEARVVLKEGVAIAVINPHLEPVPEDLIAALDLRVKRLVAARAFLTHQKHDVTSPTISVERADGSRNVTLTVGVSAVIALTDNIDILVRDAHGNVLRDSQAERIAAHDGDTRRVFAALMHHPELEALVESYLRAVADPADEFVHLYEVRDALAQLLGGEAGARAFLGISKDQWQQLGRLANAEPVEQGRHRGKYLGKTRPATDEELETVRRTVREWIVQLCDRWKS